MREMQIKTTVRYNYTHPRMVKIEKQQKTLYQMLGSSWNYHKLVLRRQNGKRTLNNRHFVIISIHLPYDPVLWVELCPPESWV